MLKVTVVMNSFSETDRWTLETWINPRYIVGFHALKPDPEYPSHPPHSHTRLWLDPAMCIKGIGIGPCSEVTETVDQILKQLD